LEKDRERKQKEKGTKEQEERGQKEKERERETLGIYDGRGTYVSTHYRPYGIKGAAFTTSHIQPFTASKI